jgi:hypothetical protein
MLESRSGPLQNSAAWDWYPGFSSQAQESTVDATPSNGRFHGIPLECGGLQQQQSLTMEARALDLYRELLGAFNNMMFA